MVSMPTKRYSDDYETVITIDEKGNEKKTAVYRGEYFEFDLDENGIFDFRKKCFLLLAAITLLHVGGGFVGNQGMYQFYVALPYVLAFLPLMYMAMSILRLPKTKRRYRRDEIGLSFDRMKTTSILHMILLVAGILGEIAFLLFMSDGSQNMLEYLYLALITFASVAVYSLNRLQGQIRIQPSLGEKSR
jgi:hypothetical protein